ncbi:hypothetical protein E4U21_003313 [Claviceps maximensis]|nr:hypothetical protein E4U21_003313 [Claviceps maximensis]
MAPDAAKTTTTTTTTTTLSTSTSSPIPTPPSPMLASINAKSHTHLIIGIGPLTATRCTQSLAAGAHPILIAPSPSPPSPSLPSSLQDKITAGLITWHPTPFQQGHLLTLGRPQVDRVVDAVFVVLPAQRDNDVFKYDVTALSPERISYFCQRYRIPVNVVDAPHLCTFSLLSVHTDGPLQIGVTTNGRGCKLAARIRREIAGLLPPGLGDACERLGRLRRRIQEEDCAAPVGDLEDSIGQGSLFNGLVSMAGEEGEKKEHAEKQDEERNRETLRNRRGRWLAQMCEYWPLKRLAGITDDHVEKLLLAYPASTTAASTSPSPSPSSSPSPLPKRAHDRRAAPGRIILAGSGPGHPDLLTLATLKAIQTADLILADKLVPSPVLDLIPRRTPVQIARKFPGNADRAQEELLEAALAGLEAGQTVLRLKQGDPYIYGRGGEEVLFFQARGMGARVSVLPGVTSALSASLFAGIPATQRDVADQVLICTGTGKKGKPPSPPSYVPSQTVVFLMALHRIGDLVAELTSHAGSSSSGGIHASSTSPPPRTLFPLQTPCAVIERASCPDQRVIRTTLEHVAQAIEAEGSRPPGLLVVGHACHVLHQRPASAPWIVKEGFRGLDADAQTEAWSASLQAAMMEGL